MSSRLDLSIRPRRNRAQIGIRNLVRETHLDQTNLIQPLFVSTEKNSVAIESLPGQTRFNVSDLALEAKKCAEAGISAVALFPKIPNEQKDAHGSEADNPNGLVPQAIAAIKQIAPQLTVITDVALDPYTSTGHDGLVEETSLGEIKILNDATVERLALQALCHAKAGADIVAPSDMMDGRVQAIRQTLDQENHTETAILAYTAKYASAFYGPFRGALDSSPQKGDKKTYQMDPANAREALREAALDEAEGADFLMVKPAGSYLDIIYQLRQQTTLPIAAYQVSGEYLMLEAAAASGWLERKEVILESLLSIRRAGANCILSYHALEVANWLS